MQDPFYKSILDALRGPLDPHQFEACVADLLRDPFPGLVPVPGGNDAGMDGAIPSDRDVPLPLVTTTARDARRNLVKNLRAHQKKHRRREAVFVTSRNLSAESRRQLHAEAEKLGFVLLQIYSRQAIANLLYRNPAWCKALLRLSGNPSALSVVPPSSRPRLNTRIVGRARDFHWLRTTQGDRIIVGQPGVGKTFLLSRFARTDGGLFVIDEDRTQLANAIRAQRPRVLIVDDAHARPGLLTALKHLRSEIHAEYAILAVSWLGAVDETREVLGLARKAARELPLLTRDQIVRVVNGSGIHGPNELVREIVNQAQGRAGLAVSLAHACIRGDLKMLGSGEALSTSLIDALARLVGNQARPILAAFAVGGEYGMALDAVAMHLKMSMPSVHVSLSRFAQGGVIREFGHRRAGQMSESQSRYAVTPPALQQTLIKEVFFGRVKLPLEPLLECADTPSALVALIGARLRGVGEIDSRFLLQLFPSTPPDNAIDRHRWTEAAGFYAHLGTAESVWVLNNYPEVLHSHASALLDRAPQATITYLLEHAINDNRSLSSTPSHPLRMLGDWLRGHQGGLRQSMKRRRVLLQTARTWLQAGKDQAVGIHAACLAFTPRIDRTEADPGSGNKFMLSWGSISHAEADALSKLWPQIPKFLKDIRIGHWEQILTMLREWTGGDLMFVRSQALRDAMMVLAHRMLADLAPLFYGRPGVQLAVHQLAKRTHASVAIQVDPEFEAIFDERYEDIGSARLEQKKASLEAILACWSGGSPEAVAQRIAYFVTEAKSIGVEPYRMRGLCWEIARRVHTGLPWCEALLAEGMSAELVAPFLNHAIHADEPGWVDFVAAGMSHDTLRQVSVQVALQGISPSWLFERALDHTDDLALALQRSPNPLPESRMAQLLAHPLESIAGAAAMQEWGTEPQGSVREALNESWRRAVLHCTGERGEDHALVKMFRADPDLAHDWLIRRFQKGYRRWMPHDHALNAAIDALDNARRRLVLECAQSSRMPGDIISRLIGGESAMYEWFIGATGSRGLQLAPLKSADDSPAVPLERVRIALKAGHSPSAVTDAIYGNSWSWHGPMSRYWQRWKEAFAPLATSEEPELRRVGQLGLRRARCGRRAALKREREEALFGRW